MLKMEAAVELWIGEEKQPEAQAELQAFLDTFKDKYRVKPSGAIWSVQISREYPYA